MLCAWQRAACTTLCKRLSAQDTREPVTNTVLDLLDPEWALETDFLKWLIFIFNYVYVGVSVCGHAHECEETGRGHRVPGVGVTGGRKPPDEGVEDEIWVLCESSVHL